jgi:hypothetical protein
MKTIAFFPMASFTGGVLFAVAALAQPLVAEDAPTPPASSVQPDSSEPLELNVKPPADSAAELAFPVIPSSPGGPLLSTSAVVGIAVKDAQGETLGHIQELMFDPKSGRVLYALVTCTSFMGSNKKSLAIPGDTLKVGLDQTVVIAELKTGHLSVPSSVLLSHRQSGDIR